jgi:A/G-specific adenine glycosylase
MRAPPRATPAGLRQALLRWFDRHKRDLPWRRSRDPYAIWVSEVMLQQTQVATVIPYWHRFLERFPTVGSLAVAELPEVFAQWRGLGYYTRARNLHRAAREIAGRHGGRLPSTAEELLSLPGFGRYTAGAVACFAYEQPVAMVDTNVRRVLSRVFGWPASAVDDLAESVVPAAAAYAWNQALMDLGATLCRARQPLCLACPLVAECGGPHASAASPRAAAGQFTGSRRYHRGRIIQRLRELPAGQALPLSDLGDRRELVDQLAADGLVTIDAGERVRLAD